MKSKHNLKTVNKSSRTTQFVMTVRSAISTLFVLMAGASPSMAQDYPTKTVRIAIPFAAGGGTDINARQLADRLSKQWKQPVIVDNLGGGGGNVAAASVVSKPDDGYTVFFTSMNVITLNPLLYQKLTYNADRDFAPVMLYSDTPHVLMISSAFPAAKLSEFIAHAKANPGTIHFGSGGHGTSQHLSGELLKIRAGVDLRHVPYKGSGQAVPAIIGNEIQMIFESISTAIGHVRNGRIRGLGVASRARAPVLPEVPTMEEGGFPGFTSGVWAGVVVRSGTPATVVNTLNRSINTVTSDTDYKKQMSDLGINLVGGTPEHLTAYIANERKVWTPIIQKLNLKLD